MISKPELRKLSERIIEFHGAASAPETLYLARETLALLDEIERLREALKPFAKEWGTMKQIKDKAVIEHGGARVNLKYLKQAAAALAGESER